MRANRLERIGRYQVIEPIGRGTMGVVVRAFDPLHGREVAIKLMHANLQMTEEHRRARFYREADAITRLKHRNIVTMYEVAEDDNTPYIVMEFLEGMTLAARMSGPVRLAIDHILDLMTQLCIALHYAHEQGVVHRDVKPENLFLLKNGVVKLFDFSIAKVSNTTAVTQVGHVLGTLAYMSPEQLGAQLDHRSDIFSTCVLLFELLAGRRPFGNGTTTTRIVNILSGARPSLSDAVPALPPRLGAAVNRGLSKDPADRFDTADQLASELHAIRCELRRAVVATSEFADTRSASTSPTALTPRTLPVPASAGSVSDCASTSAVATIDAGFPSASTSRGDPGLSQRVTVGSSTLCPGERQVAPRRLNVATVVAYGAIAVLVVLVSVLATSLFGDRTVSGSNPQHGDKQLSPHRLAPDLALHRCHGKRAVDMEALR